MIQQTHNFFLLVFSVLVPLVASPAHRQPLRALCRRRRCELHQHSLHETEVRSPSPQLRSTRRYSAICVPPQQGVEVRHSRDRRERQPVRRVSQRGPAGHHAGGGVQDRHGGASYG